jgi:tRNA-2-methylthio-N6-dimethylallyladenosine synthase
MRSYFIETWGCQMNHHDTERLQGQLQECGLKAALSAEEADLVLLNTCSVREKPVHKIVSRIGRLGHADHPPAIGVCGCVAQQEGAALLRLSRHVAFVLGPGQTGRVAEALRAFEQGERAVFTGFDAEADYNFQTIFRTSNTRGMVTVIEGCNEYCTFCIVPYTRGRESSRTLRHIVAEVTTLAESGVREIELLGQTINQYECPESGADLAVLLDTLARMERLSRIRFITSHPRHFGDRLIEVMARHPKVSRYLHLPIQSGSDRILKRMNRKYTREDYLRLVDRIRDAVPDINLSTDVIVGFPGEDDDAFQESLDVLERVRFGQVFAFAYSARPRTPAASYEDPVSEDIKMDRLHRLFDLTDQISRELNEGLVGATVPVLIDSDSRLDEDHWQGRGEDNRIVNFPKKGMVGVGDVVDVTIRRAATHSLAGEMATSDSPRLPVIGVAMSP